MPPKPPAAQKIPSAKKLLRAASRLSGGFATLGGAGLASTRKGMNSNYMSRAGDGAKKSAFMTVLGAIERVTGLGDATDGQDDEDQGSGHGGAAKKSRFSRLAWGLEIWDMMCVAVELIYEPELLKQRLTVIASHFFSYGCRNTHLKTIGMALQGVIGEILIVHLKTPWSAISLEGFATQFCAAALIIF
mmetsp:Transcript_15870/g.42902  ORF Transcript_15870/g.42902 Transcript_15870/m.42902 type:complete len:189 (-) Transcript_15870:2190-2756(-)